MKRIIILIHNYQRFDYSLHFRKRGMIPLSMISHSLISVYSLNFNKLSRINPVHQTFVLENISHLIQAQIAHVSYLHLPFSFP